MEEDNTANELGRTDLNTKQPSRVLSSWEYDKKTFK
jgi:hypothetical protein